MCYRPPAYQGSVWHGYAAAWHSLAAFARLAANLSRLFEEIECIVQQAAELLRQSTSLDRSDEKTWLHWGLVERRRGNWQAARTCFKNGSELIPHNADIHQVQCARMYLKYYFSKRHVAKIRHMSQGLGSKGGQSWKRAFSRKQRGVFTLQCCL